MGFTQPLTEVALSFFPHHHNLYGKKNIKKVFMILEKYVSMKSVNSVSDLDTVICTHIMRLLSLES
jgi:hypothetical protein